MQNHKTLKVLQKVLFDKTVIIIIIVYNIVPFWIHPKILHVPQLLSLNKYLVNNIEINLMNIFDVCWKQIC